MMQLFGHPFSSYTWKVLIALYDGDVPFDMQRVVAAHRASPGSPDQAEIAAARDALARTYRWIEAWLAAEGEPPAVTLLTCAAAPSLFYADWVQPIAKQGCTRLVAWRSALLTLPPVARCVEAARPYRPWFPPGAPDRD